jgi:prepilin signal peptidase PulO-like enzyme (type II secretory pathway)
MLEYLVIITIIFAFYILSAYATTDILRLLKGSSTPVYAPDCFCDNCKNKIRLIDQVPIFAYLFNRGRCHHCKCKIPAFDILFEVLILVTLTVTNVFLRFGWIGFAATVAEYEIIKLVFLLIKGKREEAFAKNLLISLLTNILVFLLVGILYGMLAVVRARTV